MRLRDDERGISVVDLIMGLVLTAAVFALSTLALQVVSRTDVVVDENSQVLAQLRTTTQRLTRELRQARRVFSDSTDKRLHFWLDRNSDDVVDADERIIWTIIDESGNRATLRRGADESLGAPAAADFLFAPSTFAYSKDNAGVLQPIEPEAATVVTVAFAADLDPDDTGGAREVRTDVRLRNVLG